MGRPCPYAPIHPISTVLSQRNKSPLTWLLCVEVNKSITLKLRAKLSFTLQWHWKWNRRSRSLTQKVKQIAKWRNMFSYQAMRFSGSIGGHTIPSLPRRKCSVLRSSRLFVLHLGAMEQLQKEIRIFSFPRNEHWIWITQFYAGSSCRFKHFFVFHKDKFATRKKTVFKFYSSLH